MLVVSAPDPHKKKTEGILRVQGGTGAEAKVLGEQEKTRERMCFYAIFLMAIYVNVK